MIVRLKKGPNPINRVTDNYSNDITDLVIQYLGPQQDWHMMQVTPQLLDCDTIEIELCNGNRKKFSNNEFLCLNF